MPTPTTRCLNKNLSMKFFSKCDQIRRKRQIWSHLLKKSWIENFIFFGVLLEWDTLINILFKTHKRMNPIVWSLFPQKLLKPHFKWETEDLIDAITIFLPKYVHLLSIFKKGRRGNIMSRTSCALDIVFCSLWS